MPQPPYLKPGDKLIIISSARRISLEELQPSIQKLKDWGLEVDFGKNLFSRDNQFAGTESERVEDLQAAIDDPTVKAILFARGGYGSVQIVDQINWTKLHEHPKWLIGYSDITVFHAHINRNLGLESLHATMPIDIKADDSGLSQEALDSLRSTLFGDQISYRFPVSPMNKNEGSFEGELVGGNLSILYNLSGTASQMDLNGKILFIEDLDEYLYHIDRMLMNLLRSNLLHGCNGILVGGMTKMNDNSVPFGKNAEEIIIHRLGSLGIPIVFNVSAGHIYDNRSLIFGRKIKVSQENDSILLEFYGRA